MLSFFPSTFLSPYIHIYIYSVLEDSYSRFPPICRLLSPLPPSRQEKTVQLREATVKLNHDTESELFACSLFLDTDKISDSA